MAPQTVENGVRIRLACMAFGISQTCYRYQAKPSAEKIEIADHLIRLTHNQRNWGFGRCFLYLRHVKGYRWNHQRVYRLDRELERHLRIKPRTRIVREKPEPLAVPETIHQCWSMDFMPDQLSDGRSYRLFKVIDDFNREALAIDIDLSLPSERVVRSLDQIIEWRGKPQVIRSDNGPESISGTFIAWAERRGIRLDHLQPGNPQQHAYIERYHRTVRYDWLRHYLFESIEEVQNDATDWMWTYHHQRPNRALGGMTPKQKSALLTNSTSDRC